MSEGWKCPACGGAHAPDVKTCPIFEPLPRQAQPQLRSAGCLGCDYGKLPCGCVLPGHVVEITCF